MSPNDRGRPCCNRDALVGITVAPPAKEGVNVTRKNIGPRAWRCTCSQFGVLVVVLLATAALAALLVHRPGTGTAVMALLGAAASVRTLAEPYRRG